MKKILGTLLSTLMIVTCVCLNTNIKVYAIPAAKVSTAYVNAAGVAQANKDCTPIATSTTSIGTDSTETWYVANEDVEVGSLTVNGNVNLILADGKTLTVTDGIILNNGSSLTIWGQTNGTGKLETTTISGPSNYTYGSLTINGGIININKAESYNNEAINVESINIANGTVTVGGDNYYWGMHAVTGVEISGGVVNTNGVNYSGWYGCGINVDNGNITISGGVVNTSGKIYDESPFAGNSYGMIAENIIITGGTVTSEATTSNDGQYSIALQAGAGTIEIKGGTVTAIADSNNSSSVGIHASTINISDGTTKAKGYNAIKGEGSLTIDTSKLSIDGANETYASGVTSLTNKTGTEYVTITPITPTGGNSNNNSGGNAGESTNKKVVNTSVK